MRTTAAADLPQRQGAVLTMVGITALPEPEMLVSVDGIAILRGQCPTAPATRRPGRARFPAMLLPLLAILVQAPSQAPPPSLPIPRLDTSITIDGVLDEPAWTTAARLERLPPVPAGGRRPAEEETILLVWYAPNAIHFGIIAHDNDPRRIHATGADATTSTPRTGSPSTSTPSTTGAALTSSR